jgi:hypothetical protein
MVTAVAEAAVEETVRAARALASNGQDRPLRGE